MTEWSAVTIAAAAAGAAVVIGAGAGGIVSIITAWRTIATKVSAIEGHVNSEKTAADGRIETLRKENELLREMLADRKTTAALLAQAQSHAIATGRPSEQKLDEIAASTAAIDENTKP